MAVTPEGKVKDQIKKILNNRKILFFMPNMSGMGATGLPDFIICIDGQMIAVEAKRDGTAKLTTKQDSTMKKLRRAGVITLLVHADNLNNFESFIFMFYYQKSKYFIHTPTGDGASSGGWEMMYPEYFSSLISFYRYKEGQEK